MSEMLRLKGQRIDDGKWVEFEVNNILETFEDEVKISLDGASCGYTWIIAATIQPADDPRKAMLDELREQINNLPGTK